MAKDYRIKLALDFDDWCLLSAAAVDTGNARGDSRLISLAAKIERSLHHSAVAGSLEAQAERMIADWRS